MDNQTLIKNLAAKANRDRSNSASSEDSINDFNRLDMLRQIEFFKGKDMDLLIFDKNW